MKSVSRTSLPAGVLSAVVVASVAPAAPVQFVPDQGAAGAMLGGLDLPSIARPAAITSEAGGPGVRMRTLGRSVEVHHAVLQPAVPEPAVFPADLADAESTLRPPVFSSSRQPMVAAVR